MGVLGVFFCSFVAPGVPTPDTPSPSTPPLTSPPLHLVVTDYFGTNLKDDLFALWKIWVPSTIINFSFMPMWGRIPWVASTSLIWTCILSMMRGGSDDIVIDDDEVIGPHVSGKTMKIYSGAYEVRRSAEFFCKKSAT